MPDVRNLPAPELRFRATVVVRTHLAPDVRVRASVVVRVHLAPDVRVRAVRSGRACFGLPSSPSWSPLSSSAACRSHAARPVISRRCRSSSRSRWPPRPLPFRRPGSAPGRPTDGLWHLAGQRCHDRQQRRRPSPGWSPSSPAVVPIAWFRLRSGSLGEHVNENSAGRDPRGSGPSSTSTPAAVAVDQGSTARSAGGHPVRHCRLIAVVLRQPAPRSSTPAWRSRCSTPTRPTASSTCRSRPTRESRQPQDFQGLVVPGDGMLNVNLGDHLRRRTPSPPR